MSAHSSKLLADLVAFFEDRNLPEVAAELKQDLKANSAAMNSEVLASVRKAVVNSEKRVLTHKST